MVRNVCPFYLKPPFTGTDWWFQLPWSTANEDLVELFETTGQVELAEILFEGTRSKGMGVVQFSNIPEAETAIGEHVRPFTFPCLTVPSTAKFQNYMYGGRPLGAFAHY